MADEQTVNDLVDYYKNLLIIQYADKPKAAATIDLFARELAASGIIFDVLNAYNVETAVGVQLDIIGKYVGVDRFYNITEPSDYFRTPDYLEPFPDDNPAGFTDYANFDEPQLNGTLNYNSITSMANRLNDNDYRQLIKLKIIQNHSNHSHKSIDDSMWGFFGDDVIPSSDGGMNMWYFVDDSEASVVMAARTKGVLPRPMGVGMGIIKKPDEGGFFGYISYIEIQNGLQSPLLTGYTDYSEYNTKEGRFLSYRDIQ